MGMNIAIGEVDLGLITGQIGHMLTARHRSDVSSVLCSFGAISPGDGPRHSLHASTQYREYNEYVVFGAENLL